jgi:hypothetical protein
VGSGACFGCAAYVLGSMPDLQSFEHGLLQDEYSSAAADEVVTRISLLLQLCGAAGATCTCSSLCMHAVLRSFTCSAAAVCF